MSEHSTHLLSGNIPPIELKHWLDSGKPLLLLNVMTAECFSAEHLPASVQACVYETSFIDQVHALNVDTGIAIVVYGQQKQSLASSTALEKLRGAGYEHVFALEGGVEAWKQAGYATEGSNCEGKPSPTTSGRFVLDPARSLVRWNGRNILNNHDGTAQVSAGEIVIENNVLKSASFTVDMRTLANNDLADPAYKTMLIQHLKHSDFFAVNQWPEASFVATSAEVIQGAPEGSANYQIHGNFTLRGVSQSISFPAYVGLGDDDTIGGQAELDIDRTRWGANYGSGKFYEFLGKHLVSDWVHLHLKIVAVRSAS